MGRRVLQSVSAHVGSQRPRPVAPLVAVASSDSHAIDGEQTLRNAVAIPAVGFGTGFWSGQRAADVTPLERRVRTPEALYAVMPLQLGYRHIDTAHV